MFRNAFVGLTLFAACSPIVDNKNMPDAAIDAPSTTPPKILMSNPADKSKSVSPLTKIVVWFDAALDASTVNATTVKVRASLLPSPSSAGFSPTIPSLSVPTPGTDTVRGTVSYDEAQHKLTFSPARPLNNSTEFALVLNGVKDTAGNMVAAGPAITFRTYLNTNYRKLYLNTPQYTVSYYYDYPLDAEGHAQKQFYKPSTGPDGLWMTTDDPATCGYNGYSYGPEGRLLENRSLGAGPDAMCNTADDVVSSMSKNNYDLMGRLIDTTSFSAAGPDGNWGTNDDVISSWTKYGYNASGQHVLQATLGDKGADNMWKTADDRCTGCYFFEYTYDASGNYTQQIARTTGTDNIPGTADDVPQSWNENIYDATGYLTRFVVHTSAAGTDGMWPTADDPVSYYYSYANEAAGDRQKYFTGAGVDGMWFTADDVCSGMYMQALDANKLPTRYKGFGAGPDAKLCTADDVISAVYYDLRNDANGNKIDFGYACQSGADGIWDTADDRCAYTFNYDVLH